MAGPGPCLGDVIVLDPEEEEEEEAPGPSPPAPPPPPGAPTAPPTPPSRAPPAEGRDLRAENQRLFQEFVAFCAQHTREHPEVMPYLASRHQKSSSEFLASVEFRNVLGRCLSRVQAQRSKVYVYISELCTVFKAHSLRKRQQQGSSPSPTVAPATPSGASEQVSHKPPRSRTSKQQIRRLENLLKVYSEEIRRLQAQELDLDELDSENSAYVQESHLKRRMMHIFQRLCELKDCSSLTGRVIEQRIPYRGTRYPEVNRRIERLINRPEAFPDYNDILKVVQKANTRHSLELSKPQMVTIATNAFQEVGERLQERRRLDLVYNFGSYLTDEYRRENDPALEDDELARRLRHNREVAVTRLDQVLVRYVDLQDNGVEGERHPGQAKPGRATSPQRDQPAVPKEPASEAVASAAESGSELKSSQGETSPDYEEEDEESDEESSSDSELEAELEKSLEDGEEEEEEEEEGLAPDSENPPAQEAEADQHMDSREPELLLLDSSLEEDEEDDNDDDDGGSEDQAEVEELPPPLEPEPPGDSPALNSPSSQQFLLEIEAALPLEASETPPPSPAQPPPSPPLLTEQGDGFPISLPNAQPLPLKRSRSLENGGSFQPTTTASCRVNGQPPSKRVRQDLSVSKSSYIEVPSGGSSEDESEGLMSPLSPHSPVPLVDSTSADSPGVITSSTRGSPQPGLLQVCKASVATQCDPEEIIVLDSD